MFWEPPLLCCQKALGAEKILFAVDYPLESNEVAVKFMEDVPISESDKEKICHLNAEALFGL
jgi:predicted TIM-barrel fold metal-dependent hydrolase